MTSPFTHRLVCLAAALLLGGCSALQIDVDVYKGGLTNSPEVQQRQFAHLATAAKPLILQMKAAAVDQRLKCDIDKGACSAVKLADNFLTEILYIYQGDKDTPAPSIESKEQKDSRLVNEATVKLQTPLVRRTITAGVTELRTIEALAEKLTTAHLMESGEQREKAVRAATADLTDALIGLAQRILYVVDHQSVFSELQTGGTGPLKVMRPVLQSLANTLLVHANDLQRQRTRDVDLANRSKAEVAATRRAYRVSPVDALDEVTRLLTQVKTTVPGTTGAASAEQGPGAELKQSLASKEAELAAAQADAQAFRQSLHGLFAATRTLGGSVAVPGEPAPGDAARDGLAVTRLYPAQPADAVDKTQAGALRAVREWLDRERSDDLLAERKLRLVLTHDYLERKKDLLTAGVAQAATKSDALRVITGRLNDDSTIALGELARLKARAELLGAATVALRAQLAALSTQHQAAQDATTKRAVETGEAARIAAVLALVRSEVLAQGSAAGVSDRNGIQALLKVKLANFAPPLEAGKPSADDITLTRRRLEALPLALHAICEGAAANTERPSDADKSTTLECEGKTQIDVVDTLIASLRAQRIRALAQGDEAASEHLLAAINVAYEQRTSLIYLRPASDYLRSVHTNSDLQTGGDPQYRDMLTDWLKYIDPTRKFGTNELRKDQLDKLNWQNINTVTVNGGGFTNFVLAKDDVGNWYVKAYSSDPEAIFKSATSLALYNAGGRVNANLLKRHDMLNRMDATDDKVEKARLGTQLENLDSQNGAPLLALRARYAERYANATRETAADLQQQLTDMSKTVDKLVSGTTTDDKDLCKIDEFKQGLADLDSNHLAAPRDKLGTLLPGLGITEPDKQLVQMEAALQAGLLALNVYGNKVFKVLDDSPTAQCLPAWKRKVAERARDVPRSQLLRLAKERRDSVERYEEALLNISQVAAQK